MGRGRTIVVVLLEGLGTVRDWLRDLWAPPYRLLALEPELERLDLTRPEPYAPARPTERSVRPVRDQRPYLERFTLPRTACVG